MQEKLDPAVLTDDKPFDIFVHREKQIAQKG
jgi:hypothetical protein